MVPRRQKVSRDGVGGPHRAGDDSPRDEVRLTDRVPRVDDLDRRTGLSGRGLESRNPETKADVTQLLQWCHHGYRRVVLDASSVARDDHSVARRHEHVENRAALVDTSIDVADEALGVAQVAALGFDDTRCTIVETDQANDTIWNTSQRHERRCRDGTRSEGLGSGRPIDRRTNQTREFGVRDLVARDAETSSHGAQYLEGVTEVGRVGPAQPHESPLDEIAEFDNRAVDTTSRLEIREYPEQMDEARQRGDDRESEGP